MAIITKRTVMSMYSDHGDIYSHQVRMVLAEKGVNVEIISIHDAEVPDEVLASNPYGTMPVLVDRELVLYKSRIIMEYLDERFPHPPLLPVYPVARAETRKMLYRIEKDWYALMNEIQSSDSPEEARSLLLESLISLDPLFLDTPYFLSEELSLLDCALAPLLWRLPKLGIIIPALAEGLQAYMARVFNRPCFEISLTDAELQLRAA